MRAPPVRVSPGWLRLREPADAAARSAALAERLAAHLAPGAGGLLEIHDLGGGSGAMGRWLAPRLPGPQRWVVHDIDEALLELALADPPRAAAAVEVRPSDVTRLAPAELAGADVVVASALLDLLTADELAAILSAWRRTCPLLVTLTVTGRVALAPADPLDAHLAGAFNAHQRRGRLLGPDALTEAVAQLREAGARCLVAPAPWRLGPADAGLVAEWLAGWVGAACEQAPELTVAAGAYTERRLAQLAAGDLAVTVDHADLLVLP